ncbi:MAG: hypothetical protein ACLFWG_06605, partial [Longimicrobiales bacterium]
MAFATSSEQPAGTRDDALAAKACVERGLDVISAPWDDPTVRWESFSAVVVRSTWNYSRKIGLFNEWIDRIEASGTRLFNDPDTLRWNADKSYLLELSEAGVPIIPTVRIENSGE